MLEDGDDDSLYMNSISDYSSVEIRNDKFNNNMFKNKNDTNIMVKGYHRVFRKVNNKKIPIYLHTTRYTPGSKIRNAISGFGDRNIVVGRNENLFFKVGMCTGELGKDPYGTHLYYDSPEQYEKHFHTYIDKKTKDLWWVKYRSLQQIIDNELENKNISGYTIIH